MPITLYRRHTGSCHVHDLRLSAKATRRYMDCQCPLWLYGRTDATIVPRQSTGTSDLKKGEAIRASLEAEGKDQAVHGPRISECIEKYLASRNHELGEKAYGQHKLLLSRLRKYCEIRGVHFAHELSVDLLETFKTDGLPELADTSKSTSVAKLRCFLRHAFRRGWIAEPLVDKVTPHKAVYEQKEPFTDEEVQKILEEALKLKGGTNGYAKHPKTFRVLLEFMLKTGMRVGDAINFDPAACKKGEHMWIYSHVQQKRKRTEKPRIVECYISDLLKADTEKCEWLSPKLPFRGSGKDDYHYTQAVYERMQNIGERCGVRDCRPHRLRDTFAVCKLLAGFQLDDVSRLLGHSSVKVTEAYYAKWTTGRKRRLERMVAQSLMNSEGDALGNGKANVSAPPAVASQAKDA